MRTIENVLSDIRIYADRYLVGGSHAYNIIKKLTFEAEKIHKAEQEPYKVCDQVTWECNILIDEIRKQLIEEKEFAYADFDEYKYDVLGVDDVDDLPDDDFRYGLERAIEIIDKYKGR